MDHPQSFARSEMLSSSLPASAPVERAHEAGDADRPLTSEGRPEQHQNTGPISSENVDGHPSTPHRTIRLPHYRTLTGHVASPSRTPLFTAGSDPLSTPPSAFRQPLPAPAPRDGPLPSVPSSTFPYTASAMGATRRDSRDDGTLPAFPSRHHHHHDQHSPHGHGEFPPPPFSTSVLITPSKTAPAPPLAVQTGAVGRTVYSSGVRRLPGPDGSQMIPLYRTHSNDSGPVSAIGSGSPPLSQSTGGEETSPLSVSLSHPRYLSSHGSPLDTSPLAKLGLSSASQQRSNFGRARSPQLVYGGGFGRSERNLSTNPYVLGPAASRSLTKSSLPASFVTRDPLDLLARSSGGVSRGGPSSGDRDVDMDDDRSDDGVFGDMESPRRRAMSPNRREVARDNARRARIESEQRRRDELREGFKTLKSVLPPSGQRASKSSLLDGAVAHIQQIEAANRYLHEQNQRIVADNEKLRDTNHKLVQAQAKSMGSATSYPDDERYE